MAIDPSIIGNVMAPQAPQLPDVNAMMQTRTAGMEGIYRLERQREADALAAQDRELDAAAKALAPAIASAFSDPTDEGLDAALSMVPPAYREAATAQIEQLRSIPDLNRRKDIIRAGLAQDDYGRAILAQLEPTANMRLQADTAAARAALDARRLQLEENKLAMGEQMTPYQEAQIELERQKIEAAKSKETAEETKKRLADEKRAKDLDLAIGEVEGAMTPGGLIDQSTGSYIGNLIDGTMATIGVGTPGYEANAKLAPIADLVLKMVPRFEGPQSNYDVQSYKDAAGNLADPTVPNSVKKAAAKEIVRLFKKYRDQFEYAPDGAGSEEPPGGPRQISTDEEYDALPSGTEFLDPDGVLRRKP